MNFNNPIPRAPMGIPGESSPLRSPRDRQSLGHAWKYGQQANRRAQDLSNRASQLHQALGRVRRPLMSSDPPFHPFKVYNVPQSFCPPANPALGYDPAKDSWRTFAVRGGLVGSRPRYVLTLDQAGNPFYFSNYEYVTSATGTDGFVAEDWTVSAMANDWDNSAPGVQDGTGPSQIIMMDNTHDWQATGFSTWVFVLNSQVGASGITASFWLEIDDARPGFPPITSVWARMWCPGAGSFGGASDITGRLQYPFPVSTSFTLGVGTTPKLVIPLATVSSNNISQPQNLTVGQILYGNYVANRTAATMPYNTNVTNNTMAMGPTVYRGDWDADNLSGQVFYPGDVISSQHGAVTNAYVHSGVAIETVKPTLQASIGSWISLAFVS